jgi:hypothetical protein
MYIHRRGGNSCDCQTLSMRCLCPKTDDTNIPKGIRTRPEAHSFLRGCPGWGANPGPLNFIYFLIYHHFTAEPQLLHLTLILNFTPRGEL